MLEAIDVSFMRQCQVQFLDNFKAFLLSLKDGALPFTE